jgi:hypothetical protein
MYTTNTDDPHAGNDDLSLPKGTPKNLAAFFHHLTYPSNPPCLPT